MQCKHCHKDGPEGPFCTWCGYRQLGDERQIRHFALYPREHVVHPGVITTLFPHLDAHKVQEFRWALAAGLACVFVLSLAGLIVAALLCAAVFVPILYLIYLYEAQIYRDEPAAVLGFTIGGGIVLGIVVTVFVKTFTGTLALLLVYGNDVGALLILGLLVPLIQEVLKPIPAMLLRRRPAFPERVDGLVFGVAAGLGFSIAETIIRFSAAITSLPIQTPGANWIVSLITLAVLLPLLHGSATGAITAALWRRGRGATGLMAAATILVAVAAHVGFILGSQLLVDDGQAPLIVLAWQALMVAVLLVQIRVLLHRTLLEEAMHMGLRQCTCSNCHHAVSAANFCPSCGRVLGGGHDRVRDHLALEVQ